MRQTTRDAQWREAKKRCRLSGEALAMAKEMGLNPRSLIKNIPSPRQPWKQPVEAWVREMYAKRGGRSAKRGNNRGKLTHPGEASSRTSDVLADLSPESPPVSDTQAWAARGYPIDANIASLVDAMNRFAGLRTFSSCGGHPPPLSISQAPEGHFWVCFDIDPEAGGWQSLQNLAWVVADLEEVTIKIWLAGDTPDTIAFELSGIGDPANLAALIEASGLIPTDPDSPLRDNPAFTVPDY